MHFLYSAVLATDEITISSEKANMNNTSQTGYTTSVPQSYKTESEHGGSVERLDYDSLDYARDSSKITKTAYVYTPYGYDESDTDFSGSIDELRQFHRDFEENLMPAVEGKYHTYAQDTTREGLKVARDHRIFGGFSLGSVTTWLEFCYDYDYIEPADRAEMTFSRNYVRSEMTFEFQTDYSFNNYEIPVDEGRMSRIEINTEQFARIDSLEVKRSGDI
ncbi:MAG: hypothetical protein IJ192_06710 [Clostridia bacterium]|nr:hypothetical protein [Clostridia bacterium]